MINPYIPVVLLLILGIGLGLILTSMAAFLGPKNPNPDKSETFECGVPQVGGAPQTPGAGHEPMSVRYYLTAIMFILFDIETVFLFLWARAFRALGWFGLIEVFVFLAILVIGYIYVLKKGALEWD